MVYSLTNAYWCLEEDDAAADDAEAKEGIFGYCRSNVTPIADDDGDDGKLWQKKSILLVNV